jgi:hypothetical protein
MKFQVGPVFAGQVIAVLERPLEETRGTCEVLVDGCDTHWLYAVHLKYLCYGPSTVLRVLIDVCGYGLPPLR